MNHGKRMIEVRGYSLDFNYSSFENIFLLDGVHFSSKKTLFFLSVVGQTFDSFEPTNRDPRSWFVVFSTTTPNTKKEGSIHSRYRGVQDSSSTVLIYHNIK